MHTLPTVHILLATFNGTNYLAEQLQSISRQSHSAWTLTVSDDGSTDDTLTIVQRFAAQVEQPVIILQGPKQGSSTANFSHLLAQAPTGNSQDLYAFCDQDDVWHGDKLRRAVQFHEQHHNQPVRLYCGRTLFVNERLQPIGLSPRIQRPPSFDNALVQNIASGNTMVFSYALLLAQKKILPTNSVWHDWTTYIVATGLGGIVFFDNTPCLLYRQHRENLIGANNDFRSEMKRILPILSGRYRRWLNTNEKSIQDIHIELTENSKSIFSNFQMMRNSSSFITRLNIFFTSNIRRQSFTSNVSFVFSLIIGIA